MKKSETVISVTKGQEDYNKNTSIIKPDYTRNIEFKKFDFEINEKGIPYITNVNSENDPSNYSDPDEFLTPNKKIPF